ncbi:hypothetical protein QBC32DRAFT_105892 [Pseudoneurospora amorphoporcata]|uniref:Uncharacterized protein n=1 Tax=Pseudoneurospora amorphoporcata TaxID=241081 RepID=A0AAN6SB08_9PEZI|nr:hypothetical protein QBC32DRAFT_105892 [Pseudoneurospora amorphoporcata]
MPWEYDQEALCRGEPIIQHMKQLDVLTSVCRHLRYEVTSEYFNRAQAHVTHCVGGFRTASDVRVLTAMRHIKASSLFTNHLRHIRLTWLPDTLRGWLHWGSHMGKWVSPLHGLIPIRSKEPGKELRQVNTLRWLASLKSLQTLEIGFMDVLPGLYGEPMFFGRNTLEWRGLLKPLKLESISFRLYSARRREEFTKNWENSEGFLQYKRVLAEHLLKYPVVAEEKQRKPCRGRIDVHIGTVRSEDHPLS